MATYGDLTGSTILNGVEPDYFKYAGVVPSEGEMFKEGDKDSIVISSAMLKLFDKKAEDIIGDKMKFKPFFYYIDNFDRFHRDYIQINRHRH